MESTNISESMDEKCIMLGDSMLTWNKLRQNAEALVSEDVAILSLLTARILKHDSFGAAIVSLISSELSTQYLSADAWVEILGPLFSETALYDDQCGPVVEMTACDLETVLERDPAAYDYVSSFLFFKGFKSIQTHRAAHMLWHNDRKFLSLKVQSRCSELYGVDIHPCALIGPGLLLDHGTGVVIGETARIGARCTILHGVTLGGVGNRHVDTTDKHCPLSSVTISRRHPTIGDDVLIGCHAAILGPVCVGDGARVGSASVVLKSVPARCTAVGSPARIIGRSHTTEGAPLQGGGHVYTSAGANHTSEENAYSDVYLRTWTLWADCVDIFSVIKDDPNASISLKQAVQLWAVKVNVGETDIPIHFLTQAFREMGADPTDGVVNAKELQLAIISHIREIEDSYHYTYEI